MKNNSKNNSLATLIASIVVIVLLFVFIGGLVSNLNLDFENPLTDKDKEPASITTTSGTSTTTKPEDTTSRAPETTPPSPVPPTPSSCDHSSIDTDDFEYISVDGGRHYKKFLCVLCQNYVNTASSTREDCDYENGVCLKCGGECEHNYENYVCTECGYIAQHFHTQTNATVVLEPTCTTKGMKEYYCGVCGIKTASYEIPVVEHNYENGVCKQCGYVCSHSLENCICTVCGITQHTYNGEIHCTVCGQ